MCARYDEPTGWDQECGIDAPHRVNDAQPEVGICGSGWTGDRCTLPLMHRGDHDNMKPEEARRAKA